jgi:MGT family glycosyltransferase
VSKALFLNQPSVGHLNTLLSIATQMKEDGHHVRFLIPGLRTPRTGIQILDTAAALPDTIRRNGIDVDLIRPPLGVIWSGLFLPLKSGYAEVVYAVGLMAKGIVPYTRRILRFLEGDRPEVIVSDFAFPAAGLAAEITSIPFAVLYHSGLPFHGEGVPPFGSGLPIGAGPEETAEFARQETGMLANLNTRINAARRTFGLDPLTHEFLRRPYSPWLNLVASVEAAEAPRQHLPANTLFIGPCFGRRPSQSEFPWDRLRADCFKIYVSLGTVFNNKPDIVRKILSALDSPDTQVIVSAGGAFQSLQQGPVPGNALLFKSVPQVELLPRIDLFISHGGNNSINEALAAGKPIIVLPIGGEQGDNAARIVYLGVGRRLDIHRFHEQQLRATVAEIRTQPTFRQRATEIRHAIGTTAGLLTASRCIDWLGRNRRALDRPEGSALTITPEDWPTLLKDSAGPQR